jgi:hypothetical protein
MDCVACGARAVLRGNVGGVFANPRFAPDDLALLALWRSIGLDDHCFHACTACGHVWNECDAVELRRFMDASASEELLETLRRRASLPTPNQARVRTTGTCPACRDPVYVAGTLRSKNPEQFHPEQMRLLTWTRSMSLNAMGGADLLRACTSCGHVWGALHASMLRSLIHNSGTDGLRDRLRQLGMP